MSISSWMWVVWAVLVPTEVEVATPVPEPTRVVIPLDGEDWQLAVDPQNVGRKEEWFKASRPGAKQTQVPWIIQDAFPGYHGVAWYWKRFRVPACPYSEGRYLLRFWAVDYQAEVWLNGFRVGEHEGGESPFVFDISERVRPEQENLLAVRVLNPTHEPIDGIVLKQTPHRNKALPYTPGSAWNQGGIMDSVELLLVPPVRIEDLFVRPDWKTGRIQVQAELFHTGQESVPAELELTVSPAATGETLSLVRVQKKLPGGPTQVQALLQLPYWRLWELQDPYLYRVTARLRRVGTPGVDEYSVRCGFRDFRFENGYFRLNGRRIFLKSSHTGNCCPVGLELPHDPDLLRRDLLNAKAMRFNAIRFISGAAKRYQLDLCDEIGLLVYEESYAAWCLEDSPHLARRYDESVLSIVRRDRNHPSVVIWGLLNETPDGPVFRHAVSLLPTLRQWDDSRLVMLNSGRWDNQIATIGSLSNPGSQEWEKVLADKHPYQRVPHTAEIIRTLRTIHGEGLPLFLSEYGIGSAVDLVRVVRHYEQLGKPSAEDAQLYRSWRDQFLEDWKHGKLDECFDRPEDFFEQSLARMAGQRLLGMNAIRSNPCIVGYSMTGTLDQGMTGEGLWTTFRELKPGTTDAVFDGWAPLRWCLFVEPVSTYRNRPLRLEALLVNEDVLSPGEYPVRLEIVGPGQKRCWVRDLRVQIPSPDPGKEVPFVLPVFSDEVAIDGPSGKYRFLATFQQGAAPAGESTEFYLADPAELPPVQKEVTLWGDDAQLVQWLQRRGISVRPFSAKPPAHRELILVSEKPPAPGGPAVFAELAGRIATGSVTVFLAPAVFAKENQPTAWLPMAQKGTLASLPSWLYHKEEWCKRHPIFEGLPAGGLMDYTIYREVIPDGAFVGQPLPDESVSGGINAAIGYSSGLFVAVYRLGEGRLVLNTLRIRENLDHSPAADRLLLNMLRYASAHLDRPPAPLPPDWPKQLQAIGYAP